MRRLIFIVILIGMGLAVAGFWFWIRNPYSKEEIRVEILGPEQAGIFEEIEYTVKYKNNGNATLEDTKLVFEYPEYTLSPLDEKGDGAPISLKRKEMGSSEIGNIYPGEEKTVKLKCRLFGKEGDAKTAKASLMYKPKNLSAKYESSTTFTTVMKSVPLTFDFDIPTRVDANTNFKFTLNYFSNLNYPLTDLGIKINYPNGFNFIKSTPKSIDGNEWDVPLLNKTDGGRIEVEGKMSGGATEKMFSASLGVWQEDNFIVLKDITRGVETEQPRLSVFQRVNGSDDYTARPGENLHYEIFFRNIGGDPYTDLFLVANLEGSAFDFNSVKTSNGEFRSTDNSIIFDWRGNDKLKLLSQGEEGKVEFWVNLRSNGDSGSSKNPTLKNTVLISQVKQIFETKIGSRLVLNQKVNYDDEAFGNVGPIPPKVGKETTYTIVWEVKNYYNSVKNARVKAVLAKNVKITGKIFPESETANFSFDNNSNEIVWKVNGSGILEPGTGVNTPAPTIAFQVSLNPDAGQKGSAAPIIGEAKILGEDQWTNEDLEASSPAVNSNIPGDPTYANMGVVQ